MNPTPPVHPAWKAGWHRRSTRFKSLVAVGAVSLGFAGVGLAAAAPASADPAVNYVAVGSDTIQDVMNGFALSEGNILGSYNATNPVTQATHEIITPAKVPVGAVSPVTSCSYARPNGSSEGFAALDFSVTQVSVSHLATPGPATGCVDIARSSSAPGTFASSGPGSASTSGTLIYIPFALDAVAGAVGPSTAITDANSFTTAELTAMYGSCTPTTVGTHTYFPTESGVTTPPSDIPIDLYVPQSGSGTLKFWASKVGISLDSNGNPTGTSAPCVKQTIVAGPSTGTIVEEHDGTAVASDPNGYMPFSIAQWIAQSNGFNDRRHGAVLTMIDGVSPLNGSGALNTSFPYTREVYNVVQYDRVVNTADGNFDPVLSGLLVGTSSALCRSTITIRSYGFATLSSPTTTDNCGATTNSLRVLQ
jgi:hypothetical protein